MAWVDIANLNARAPFIDKMVTLKILRLSQKQKSRIFTSNLLLNKPLQAHSAPSTRNSSSSPQRVLPKPSTFTLPPQEQLNPPKPEVRRTRDEKPKLINSDSLLVDDIPAKKSETSPHDVPDFNFHVIDDVHSLSSGGSNNSPPVETKQAKKGWYPGKEDPEEILEDMKKTWAENEKMQKERDSVKTILDPKINVDMTMKWRIYINWAKEQCLWF